MERLGRELAVERGVGQILHTDTVVRRRQKMSERWWITLAVVLVAVWMCQSPVDASSLRHGRHRGSRRSRADPDRPVSFLCTAVFCNNVVCLCEQAKLLKPSKSRCPSRPRRCAMQSGTACEIKSRYSLPLPFSSLPSSLPSLPLHILSSDFLSLLFCYP